MEIPTVDLNAQYRSIQPEVDAAIQRVLESGSFILGKEVTAFEQEFAAYCGVAHAVGVNSGTEALQLALLACGVGAGDEVITVSHTAVATVAAIELTGARPILVDIDPRRYTIDPEQIILSITPRTRAIIPVHLYGCPADLDPLLKIANAHNLVLIEDCAQAHGAIYRRQSVGSWGRISAFSFYPTKNLGAYGDGGAVLTNDHSLAERVRMLRQYGWKERHISEIRGLNTRLDDLQAAILRVKLKYLDGWNARRHKLAGLYSQLLTSRNLVLPIEPEYCQHVFHQYVIRHPCRDALRNILKELGISTQVHYPVPIHLQPAFSDLGYHLGSLPVSEHAASQVLSLPLYPEMTEETVAMICKYITLNADKLDQS